MKYQVGDRVKVKSLEWVLENCSSDDAEGYKPKDCTSIDALVPPMMKFCGDFVTIESVIESVVANHYLITEDGYSWYDWMFEDIAYKKFKKLSGLYLNKI